ncbi:BlaI/MecI/CopY family transcriptional regulator [Prosthecobacter sp.]|uniref:BlaI/MecI/CopY family transcriptional regulator n=1 Tax=Prosthecobacter sp. TaxID=1965333 RepID=UPI00378433E9
MSDQARQLSRREREIMDIIYAKGEATASEVAEAMAEPPSYSAVRALLRILEEKGVLKHREDGRRYVFLPTEPAQKASRSALKNIVNTFFEGSLVNAVAALVDGREKISPEEIKRLESIIKQAKNR